MVDNTLQTGSNSIATDDIGGVHYQRVKIAWGADGVAGDTTTANPLPVEIEGEIGATFKGRASTYRSVGRAGTTPRRLLSIWNPAGSGKVVYINGVFFDLVQGAAMAVTVIPPIVRVYRITAAPTGGTVLTKSAKDTTLTSAATIVVTGDASADGTNSATAQAVTTTAGAHLTQEIAPRLITAAGYEPADRLDLLKDAGVVCRAGEGLVLSLDLTLATQEPATTHIVSTIDWYETN